jgi:hypothetical protein
MAQCLHVNGKWFVHLAEEATLDESRPFSLPFIDGSGLDAGQLIVLWCDIKEACTPKKRRMK